MAESPGVGSARGNFSCVKCRAGSPPGPAHTNTTRAARPRQKSAARGATLKLLRHEDAVRVFPVVGERPAVVEAEARVEPPRGLEGFGRPRLQTEPRVAAPLRL